MAGVALYHSRHAKAPAQTRRSPVPHGRAVATGAGHHRDDRDSPVAHGQKKDISIAAADILCQDMRRKLTGERPSDRYFRDVGELADKIIAGGWEELSGISAQDIMMKY